MQLLFKVECSGEDFYNQVADRVASDEAAELLRRNGTRGARPRPPHPARARHQAGRAVRTHRRDARALPDPVAAEVGPDLFPIIIEAEVQGDAGYEKWAEKESDPEVARLLRLNGREETIHAERARAGPGAAAGGPTVLSALRSLPALLRDEPAADARPGPSSAVLAVPEPARAFAVAGLAQAAGRRPIVVAVPTDDRRRAPGPRPGRLPRRRPGRAVPGLGDAALRAGQPQRRDHGPAAAGHVAPAAGCDGAGRSTGAPTVVVAPVRALLQRLGPHVEERRAGRGPPAATSSIPTDLVARLVGHGLPPRVPGRAPGRARRPGLDRRRVPLDRRRAGPHRPVGRRGRPADRVLGRRPALDRRPRPRSSCSAAASCCPPTRSGPGPAALVGDRAVGARAVGAPGRGPGLRRHGVLAAVAHRRRAPALDLLPGDAQVLLVEPRRMRDRAAELLAEEADLAAHPGLRRGAPADGDATSPACTCPSTACWPTPTPPAWTVTAAPEGPDTADGRGRGLGPGRRRRRAADAASSRDLPADGYRVVVCAEGRGGAPGWPRCSATTDLAARSTTAPTDGRPAEPGVRVVRRTRSSAASCYPPLKLAVLAEGDLTGRRRAHRRARPAPARRRRASSTTSSAGDYVVHYQHGVGRFGGMVKRGHRRRRARLPAARVQGRRQALRAVRPDRRRAPLHRRRVARPQPPRRRRLAAGQGPGPRRRSREIAQELVVLYQKRRHTPPATPSRPDTPWQHEMEEAFPYDETPDQLKAIDDVKADMEARRPMDRLVCGDVGLRQDRGGHPGRVQGRPGRQAGGGPGADHAAGPAALPDLRRPLRRLPGPGRDAVAASSPRPRPAGWSTGLADGCGRRASSAPTGCCRATSSSRTWACSSSTRSSASASATRRPSRSCAPTSTCSPSPPRPIPRTLEMSLTGIRDLTLLHTPPADRQPILTYVGEYDERAVAEAIRRELLREGQVFFVHNRVQDIEKVAAELREPGARGPHRGGPRPDGRGHPRAGRPRLLGGRATTCWCAPPSSSRASTCPRSTRWSSTGPTCSASASSTSCGAGSAGPGSGPTPTSSTRPTRSLTEEAYERLRDHRRGTPSWARASRSPCATSRSAAPATCSAPTSPATSPRSATTSTCQMVTEAVAELKGEEVRPPAEIKLDAAGRRPPARRLRGTRGAAPRGLPPPGHGHHPRRGRRHRAPSGSTATARCPPAAEALLGVGPPAGRVRAHRRARGHRHQGPRLRRPRATSPASRPVELPTSKVIRLRRLYKDTVYKEDLRHLQLPVSAAADSATTP